MTRRRPRKVITQREIAVASALQAEIDPARYDQLLAIEQLATILAEAPELRGQIAFKGGAIMRLVTASPRLSPDLDLSLRPQLRGGAKVTKASLARILDPAQHPFIASTPLIYEKNNSLMVPALYCRHITSAPPVIVSLSFNWKRPLLLEPEVGSFINEVTQAKITIPLVNRRERFAEKVCAFLERRDDPCRDAFDLYFYFCNILPKAVTFDYASLITKVLSYSKLTDGTNINQIFTDQIMVAKNGWPGKTIFQGKPPEWVAVEPVLLDIIQFLPEVPFSKQPQGREL